MAFGWLGRGGPPDFVSLVLATHFFYIVKIYSQVKKLHHLVFSSSF